MFYAYYYILRLNEELLLNYNKPIARGGSGCAARAGRRRVRG